MRAHESELHIAFADPQASQAFVLDEVTLFCALDDVNDHIIASSAATDDPNAAVEMWLELVVRRLGDGTAPRLKAPELTIDFANQRGLVPAVVRTIPGVRLGDDHTSVDVNRLMHADIWYSFVRAAEYEHEFMETGYRSPVRILYHCPLCSPSGSLQPTATVTHASTTGWLGIDTRAVPERQRDAAEAVSEAAMRFGAVMICGRHHSGIEEVGGPFIEVTRDFAGRQRSLLVPVDAEQFAPVLFDTPSANGGYRFGVRRLPWPYLREHDEAIRTTLTSRNVSQEPAEFLYGPSWGGTAKIVPTPRGCAIQPMAFSADTGAEAEALLSPGEAVRFWVRWTDATALTVSPRDDRLALSYEVNFAAPIAYMNCFIHAPAGFSYVTGSSTRFENFGVPRRLFSVWRATDPERSYSWSRAIRFEVPTRVNIGADFIDSEFARRRTIDTFLLSQLGAIAAALAITDQRPYPLNHVDAVWFWPTALAFLATSAWVYNGRRFRWTLLLISALGLPVAVPWGLRLPPILGTISGVVLFFVVRAIACLPPLPPRAIGWLKGLMVVRHARAWLASRAISTS